MWPASMSVVRAQRSSGTRRSRLCEHTSALTSTPGAVAPSSFSMSQPQPPTLAAPPASTFGVGWLLFNKDGTEAGSGGTTPMTAAGITKRSRSPRGSGNSGAASRGMSAANKREGVVMQNVAILALTTTQRVHDLEDIMIKSWLFEADQAILAALRQVGQKYSWARGPTTNCPPHIHEWASMVGTLVATQPPDESSHLATAHRIFGNHLDQLNKFSSAQVAECRTKSCRSQDIREDPTSSFCALNHTATVAAGFEFKFADIEFPTKTMLRHTGCMESICAPPPITLEKVVGD